MKKNNVVVVEFSICDSCYNAVHLMVPNYHIIVIVQSNFLVNLYWVQAAVNFTYLT